MWLYASHFFRSLMFSRFTCLTACIGLHSFLQLNNIESWSSHILSVLHQLMYIWVVSTFWPLRTTLLWTCACRFFVWTCVFISSGHIYLAVKLLGYMVPVFDLFEELRTVCQRNCSILHSHPQRTRVLISPHHLQYFLSVFLKIAILVVAK